MANRELTHEQREQLRLRLLNEAHRLGYLDVKGYSRDARNNYDEKAWILTRRGTQTRIFSVVNTVEVIRLEYKDAQYASFLIPGIVEWMLNGVYGQETS
jgi:hypothetical protein